MEKIIEILSSNGVEQDKSEQFGKYYQMLIEWNEKINLGRGWSYGVEFLVQRTIGKFTGLIGYTWSRTERKFDREGMVINGGKTFPARYDRTHDLSVSLQYHCFL